MSLMETILSIFEIPSQCNTSGISAWKRISFTPAISSVDLKYLSAESPPRLRKLYTRYLHTYKPLLSLYCVVCWQGSKDVLCHLTEGAAFFPEVNNDADTATLGTPNAFLDGVGEVWLARTYIGPEHIGSITFKTEN